MEWYYTWAVSCYKGWGAVAKKVNVLLSTLKNEKGIVIHMELGGGGWVINELRHIVRV